MLPGPPLLSPQTHTQHHQHCAGTCLTRLAPVCVLARAYPVAAVPLASALALGWRRQPKRLILRAPAGPPRQVPFLRPKAGATFAADMFNAAGGPSAARRLVGWRARALAPPQHR